MPEWTIVERDVRDMLGEGTFWSARDNALYWVDILAPALNRLSLADGYIERWPMPEPLGWVAERRAGGFIAGFKSGFAELDLDPLSIRLFDDPEPHLPNNRMNDGKADAEGHIWCGTMDMAEEQDTGALYRLAPDRSWTRMDDGYRVPNGPAFSPDGSWLFHTDSAKRTIYRFRRGRDGHLLNREIFIRFTQDEGYPDGMTVDADGKLWVAHWGGGCISCFNSSGVLERRIALPARQITNVTFAGARLDRMFATSATVGLPASDYDGCLFEIDCAAQGLPSYQFAG